MKNSSRNFAHKPSGNVSAEAARPTTATQNPGVALSSGKKSAGLLRSWVILLALSLLPLLSSCSDKATYIRGEQGSSGQISVNPMTGAASVIITGPYEYCALPKHWRGPNICADTPTEPTKDTP